MRLLSVCLSMFCLAGMLPRLKADPIAKIVVFGDSLSDNGNAAAALASVGKNLGNYAANAFTDGPQTLPATNGPFGLWIDQFAAMIGVDDPQPFVVNTPLGPTGGILSANGSGTNFAVASALAGDNSAFSINGYLNPQNAEVPGTTNQVELFLSFNGQRASSENLYVFWAGANNIFQSLGHVSTFFEFPVLARKAADAIAGNIATLSSAGATRFVWLNLPSLGHIPYVLENSDPLVRLLGVGAGDGAALAFNDEAAQQVALLKLKYNINIVLVNTNALFNGIVAHPGQYGFANVNNAGWCGTDGVKACHSDNPNAFLFWDDLHPTTAADRILAQYVVSYGVGQ